MTVMAQTVLRLNREIRLPGRIELDGVGDVLQPVRAYPARCARARRGDDFQEPMTALNPLYSVGNQICRNPHPAPGLSPRQARAEALALLARTGIPDPASKIDSYPFQLSGGQRQRAMIAMALACRPRLLIADNPPPRWTSPCEAQILDLLADVQREFGMAVWLITHDLNLVRRFADRVAVMRAGQIVESGPVAQVLPNPRDYTRQLLASRPGRLVDAGDPGRQVAAPNNYRSRYRQRARLAAAAATSHPARCLPAPARRPPLGIVGESGSGKTTLGLALLKLVNAQTRGRVVVASQALDGLPARRAARISPAGAGGVSRPVRQPVAAPDRGRNRRRRPGPARTPAQRQRTPGAGGRSCWPKVGLSPTACHATRMSFLAANASASPSPAPWCCARSYCCWTNPPRRWTPRSNNKCSPCCATPSNAMAWPVYSSATTWR